MSRLAGLLRAVCLLTLALGWPPPAAAQAANGPALKEALLRQAQFQRDVASMRLVVHQPLGPYELHTECTWCSKEFIFCLEHSTERWGTKVDFSWTRQQLDRVLSQAERDAGALAGGYAPTQAWIDALPAFSAAFDGAAGQVLAVQQAIRQGALPTDQQRQGVTQALQQLTDGMGRSSEQLKAGVKALAVSLQQQSAYRDTIRQAIGGADQAAERALQDVENASRTHRCQGGLQEKFGAIRNDFSRSTESIATAFLRLDASSRDAEKGLAVLLGAVVNAQTEMQTILALLGAAGNDKMGSFLEQLHLAAAKQQWNELAAAYAGAK
jgi:hypothetical protein